jgi:hypothetical protein
MSFGTEMCKIGFVSFHNLLNGVSTILRKSRPWLVNFLRNMPKLSMNFKEILLCAHENFEEQNKSSIIIIILINVSSRNEIFYIYILLAIKL